MTATAVGVALSLCKCCSYPYSLPELLLSSLRVRNQNYRQKLFGQKRFCIEAAKANSNSNSNSNSSSSSLSNSSSECEFEFDFDPELRSVLELATDSELYEIETILFGPSYLSPLLKSIPFSSTSSVDLDRSMIGVDLQLRQRFIAALESRFFFLAADARSTLRGWRPSYRNVLLQLRKKLNIPCSTRLSTHDIELEIFLHLLHYDSTDESGNYNALLDLRTASDGQGSLQQGLSQWKVQSKVGAEDFRSIIFKGGGVFTLAKIYQLLTKKLSGKVLAEAANYQVKKELMKKGGQLAMINLESRVALLAAKQGFLGAASRYIGFRSMITLLGPVYLSFWTFMLAWHQDLALKGTSTYGHYPILLWGTFLADLVIQMLGTDYARILRTVYALAQIRVIRTYRLPSDVTAE